MYRPKFIGNIGTIKAKKGTCYEVEIIDISKKKVLIVHPIHLTRA
jgi:ribosomal protein L21E